MGFEVLVLLMSGLKQACEESYSSNFHEKKNLNTIALCLILIISEFKQNVMLLYKRSLQ